MDFQDGCQLEFPIEKFLGIFDLQVFPKLPTKFSSQLAFQFRKKKTTKNKEKTKKTKKKRQNDFQDGRHGGHLGFPIGTIVAIFDL